jgi:hypothetical protein
VSPASGGPAACAQFAFRGCAPGWTPGPRPFSHRYRGEESPRAQNRPPRLPQRAPSHARTDTLHHVPARNDRKPSVDDRFSKTNLQHVNIEGTEVGPQAEIDTISAASLSLANSFSTPNAISIRSSNLPSGNRFAVELPRSSVSVLTLNIVNHK